MDKISRITVTRSVSATSGGKGIHGAAWTTCYVNPYKGTSIYTYNPNAGPYTGTVTITAKLSVNLAFLRVFTKRTSPTSETQKTTEPKDYEEEIKKVNGRDIYNLTLTYRNIDENAFGTIVEKVATFYHARGVYPILYHGFEKAYF